MSKDVLSYLEVGDLVRKHNAPRSTVGLVLRIIRRVNARDLVVVQYPNGDKTSRHMAYWQKVT